MNRKLALLLAATLVVAGAWLVAVPHAAAGSCTNPCLALTLANINNPSHPSSADSISGSTTMSGIRTWDFNLANEPGSVAANNPSITVVSGYRPGPTKSSSSSLDPGQSLDLNLGWSIPVSFAPGFNSSRSMSPSTIPAAGGTQTVKVSLTRITSPACAAPDCNFTGQLQTGLNGATITAVSPPGNLNQGETFNSSFTSSSASLHLNGPILNKTYVVTVTISLPARSQAYAYKPRLSLSLTNSGPHGCVPDTCVSASSVSLHDSTLDGGVTGSGRVTFATGQVFEWDEGGPPTSNGVGYAGLIG